MKVSACNVIGRGVDDVLLFIVLQRFYVTSTKLRRCCEHAVKLHAQALRSDVDVERCSRVKLYLLRCGCCVRRAALPVRGVRRASQARRNRRGTALATRLRLACRAARYCLLACCLPLPACHLLAACCSRTDLLRVRCDARGARPATSHQRPRRRVTTCYWQASHSSKPGSPGRIMHTGPSASGAASTAMAGAATSADACRPPDDATPPPFAPKPVAPPAP